MNTRVSFTIMALLLSISICFAANKSNDSIVLKNDYVIYEIGKNGKNLNFTDKKTGKNYLQQSPESYFASIKKAGKEYNASAVTEQKGILLVKFGESGISAEIKVKNEKSYITFEVVSVSDERIEELTFLDIPLTLKAIINEPFGGSALSVNLKTNVEDQPGLMPRPKASCYARFGLVGAKAALIGCPVSNMRDIIKKVITDSPELPKSPKGGPWAVEERSGIRPYVTVVGGIRLKDVDSWIKMCKGCGFTALKFHTGNGWLKYGDYQPYPSNPDAIAELKAVIAKLHEAGLTAYFLTYSLCIAKDTSYVTPIPDLRLLKKLRYTLAEPLLIDASEMKIDENPGDISPHSKYGSANTTTFQIDNELITFSGISKEAPYGFTGCVRAAYGTIKSEHAKGAKVYEMTQVFDQFMPDPKTDLLKAVAMRTADVYNECDFDGIDFDAIDGTFIIDGWNDSWHHASTFVYEVAKRIKKPGVFDYSAFWHHFWYLRSREGSLDSSKRGHKRFVDVHSFYNMTNKKIFLPATLGWADIFNYGNSIYPERTFSDDIEYQSARCLANDWGLAISMDHKEYAKSYNLQRLGGLVNQWEDLRLKDYFPESIKEKLRVPGDEHTLRKSTNGKWQVFPVTYIKHKVEAIDESTKTWNSDNKFDKQAVKLRIEPLEVVADYDNPANAIVDDFSKIGEFSAKNSNAGVTSAIANSSAQIKIGSASGLFTAENTNAVKENAWTMVGKNMPLDIDLSNVGLGVWVYGDGKGEIINLQFKTPVQNGYGQDDYYIKVDFKGWRYIECIEPESDRITEYGWSYMPRQADWSYENAWAPIGGSYTVYMPWSYGPYRKQAEVFNLWLNNIPQGEKVECYLSPVKALPLRKTKIKNPSITIGGKTLTFPIEFEAGNYLEFRSMSDCKVYDPVGNMIQELKPIGDVPILESGSNQITFAQENSGERIRAKITVICEGNALVDRKNK